MTSCKPERDLIFALFRRIGEQPEFKEAFEKLPNAERNYMAGDFYNIIVSHSNTTERDKVLDKLKERINRYDKEHAVCEEKCLVEKLRGWIAELRTPTQEAEQ